MAAFKLGGYLCIKKAMKLVADAHIPYLKGALEPYFDEVLYLPGAEIANHHLVDADALLIRTRTHCNRALLEGTAVKFIGSATIGFDHIDTAYCAANGITWTNAPGCNAGGVQQWVFAAMLTLLKQQNRLHSNLTLGVVGVGNVGKRVVATARAMGFKVLCCDPPRQRTEGISDFVDIDTLVQHSDIVTFHVPLNREGAHKTYHMVSHELLAKFKRGALLLNSSRGEVVNTNALKDAIDNGTISACALDVWEEEPHVNAPMLGRVSIVTPHIAGYSLEGKVNGTVMVVRALSQFFGFGAGSWFPTPNPLVPLREISVACGAQPTLEDVYTVVNQSYPILTDDEALRKNPERFEMLRNSYNLRRDFDGCQFDAGWAELFKPV